MPDNEFHPDLRRTARWLPRGVVSPRTLGTIRALTRVASVVPAKHVEIERVGPISVRVHRPGSIGEPRAALLWIHGGGYVLGSAAQDDSICRHLAERLGIVVAAVEYRLAPDYRFPVPLHDCYAALTWLARQRSTDPDRIAVGGASAGGGLAAALALLAHERGELQLAFQLLSYPMLDDRTANRTDIDERMFRLWNTKANRFGWQSYTGCRPGSDGIGGLAAPRVTTTSPVCRRPGSASGPSTCSTRSALPMRIASGRPGSIANSTWSQGRSTDSTPSDPRRESRGCSAQLRLQHWPRPFVDHRSHRTLTLSILTLSSSEPWSDPPSACPLLSTPGSGLPQTTIRPDQLFPR